MPNRLGVQNTERWPMSETADNPLTHRQRLTRGLAYSAIGPVYVARGIVGLGVRSAQLTGSECRRRYQEAQLARKIAAAQHAMTGDLAVAQDSVIGLPQVIKDASRSAGCSRRPWVIVGITAAVLAGGAVAFHFIRGKSRPELTTESMSVEVQQRP